MNASHDETCANETRLAYRMDTGSIVGIVSDCLVGRPPNSEDDISRGAILVSAMRTCTPSKTAIEVLI